MTDSPSVAPALTKEEWVAQGYVDNASAKVSTDVRVDRDGEIEVDRSMPDDSEMAWLKRRHALAALCLHEQSFGFTMEDVKACEAARCGSEAAWVVDRLASLASRISALLPPSPGDHP